MEISKETILIMKLANELSNEIGPAQIVFNQDEEPVLIFGAWEHDVSAFNRIAAAGTTFKLSDEIYEQLVELI